MKRILAAEWIKIVNTRQVWMLCLLYGGLFFASVSVLLNFLDQVVMSLTGSTGDWVVVAWIGHWFNFLPGFVMIHMVCMEFEYGTARQNIVDGCSHLDFFAGKLVLVGMLCLFSLVLFLLVAATNTAGSVNPGAVFGFTLNCAGILVVAMAFAFICRRAATAGFLFVCYPLIIEPLLGYAARQNGLQELTRYLPAEAFSALTPLPVSTRPIGAVAVNAQDYTVALVLMLLVAATAYFAFLLSEK